MLPTLMQDSRIKLLAATDPNVAACERFEKDFGVKASSHMEEMCASSVIDAVYIASPHQLHAQHVQMAAQYGKHVWVEKPMAISVEECLVMIEACKEANVQLMVGHSHAFDRPVLKTRDLILSNRYGSVQMVMALNYTDFLYRPRRPEELITHLGGGVIFSQGAHQVDVVRRLCGGDVLSVNANALSWDASRGSEGAYNALLKFHSGAQASLTYSGYAHFDSNLWMDRVGELGVEDSIFNPAQTRDRLHALKDSTQEAQLKSARNYGGSQWSMEQSTVAASHHQHFGPLVVSCEGADLRPTPKGIFIDSNAGQEFLALEPPKVARQEVIDEFYEAVFNGLTPMHNGEWALGTLEVCLAMLESSKTQNTIRHLSHQQVMGQAYPG
jgi:phthalate 4,5-cis-dihydrodiol dehydrogenase